MFLKKFFKGSSISKDNEKSEKTVDFSGRTASLLPEMEAYGSNLICDNICQFHQDTREIQLFYQTRFYDTDKQLRWSDWGFSGCVLKIKDHRIKGRAFCYNEKIFQKIIPAGYEKAGKMKGFQIYAPNGEYAQQNLEYILDWLEKNLCDMLSYICAVSIREEILEMIFWKPELYPVETICERIKEIL